jgi:hypothetical protein
MSDEQPANMPQSLHDRAASRLSQHRFLAMIVGSISIAGLLTSLGLSLYNSTGTAQLDLSRPSYSAVRSKAATTEKIESFSNLGPIDDTALSQFRTLYSKQLVQMNAIDAFGGDALTDGSLKID